jgi:integrase
MRTMGGTRHRRQRGLGSLRYRFGCWRIRYTHAGRLVEQATDIRDPGESGRRKAEDLLLRKVKTTDTPLYVAPSAEKVRFEKLVDLIERDYARKENRSRIDYKVAHLAAHFGGWRAMAIDSDHVEAYADARIKAGAAVATVNRELAALRRMFKLAVRAKLLPSMPAAIELRPEHNRREGFLDPPDLAVALDALRAKEQVAADLVEIAYYTMLRRENVVGLTWPMVTDRQVDGDQLVAGTLRLPGTMTKNKRPMVLPLSGGLLAAFQRRWLERSLLTPHVFHRQGRPVRTFDAAWEAARAATGRPDLRVHDLRRSGARTLRRQKIDQLTIMARGGWKTNSMFERYSITDEQDQLDATAALDTARAAPGPPRVTPLPRSKRPKRS